MLMKTKWLFPHRFRLIGWLFFIPAFILGLGVLNGNDLAVGQPDHWTSIWWRLKQNNNIVKSIFEYEYLDEIAAVGIIVGLLLIAFSREKVEDEMIGQLRLEALQWSVYANYIILAIAILTVYDTAFFNVMIYNMFTVLLVFIIRFRWLIYRNSHTLLAL